LTSALDAKRLGLLHQLVPQATTVGALLNPNFPSFEGQLKDVQEAARVIGVQIFVLRASDDREVEAVFETIDRDRGEPRGSAPPTPPGIRVRTAAVREVGLTSSEQGGETERSEVCIGKPQ